MHFDGPKMFVAAAEETQENLIQGRGDAYCGMLNASYNLALRNIGAYIPEYPVGDADDCADMIHEFLPIARAIYGLNNLKIISFGPRPLNFLACNSPIKQLYNMGVEIEENSEHDLFEAFNKHAGDERIPDVVKDMEKEFEGVAYGLRDSLEVAKSLGVAPKSTTICDGGAKSVLWRKIVANVMNMQVDTVEVEEGPAYGGAILAAVANGCFENVEAAAAAIVRKKDTTMPSPQLVEKYEKGYAKFKQFYPALKGKY